MQKLDEIFEAFCAFGKGKSSSQDLNGPTTMDGPRFAKFCKDCGLIKGKVTTVDVDITFNKVKAKNARRIDSAQFFQAVSMLAEKLFENVPKEEALNSTIGLIMASGGTPKLEKNTTTFSNQDITQRLTDHTQYTGVHKNKFDKDGKGLGLAGKDKPDTISDLSQVTNRKPADARGVERA